MNDDRLAGPLMVGGLLGAGVWLVVGTLGVTDVRGLLGASGIQLTTTDALNEARAIYGGLMLAMAGVQGLLALRPGWRRIGMGLWTVLLAGLVGGRLWSVVIDGWPLGIARGLLAIESLGFLVGAALLVLSRPTRGS
jgi:hypothetical protein